MGTNGIATASALTPAAAVEQDRFSSNLIQGKDTVFAFKKAVKYDAKLRLALAGPGGAGKTYTLLKLATELGGRIAVVDTEHGSASKYADEFSFDVLELSSYDPAIVPDLITYVAQQGYATLIFDSLTHFWNGKDGELEQVDNISARSKSGNSWAAWREVSPKHNAMVDAMLCAPIHILCSMRVKTEWLVETVKGKSVPRKVGLQPIMRDGIEYEFDVCGDLDQENTLVITKTRCSKLSGKVYQKPGREIAATLREWLVSPVQKPAGAAIAPAVAATPGKPWNTRGEFFAIIQLLRERIGEVRYQEELDLCGVRNPAEITSTRDALAFYNRLNLIAQMEVM